MSCLNCTKQICGIGKYCYYCGSIINKFLFLQNYNITKQGEEKEKLKTLRDIDLIFFDENSDTKISKDEYMKNIQKYFNSELESIPVYIDIDVSNNNTYFTNFKIYDKDNNSFLDKNELLNLSTELRNPGERFKKDFYSSQNIFKEDTKLIKGFGEYSLRNKNNVRLFQVMRFLVDIYNIKIYVNFNKSVYPDLNNKEENIFNFVCKYKNCKFFNLFVKDFNLPFDDILGKWISIAQYAKTNSINLTAHCTAGDGRTGFMMLAYLLFNDSDTIQNKILHIDEILNILPQNIQDLNFQEKNVIKEKLKNSYLFKFLLERYRQFASNEVFAIQNQNKLKLLIGRMNLLSKLIHNYIPIPTFSSIPTLNNEMNQSPFR